MDNAFKIWMVELLVSDVKTWKYSVFLHCEKSLAAKVALYYVMIVFISMLIDIKIFKLKLKKFD